MMLVLTRKKTQKIVIGDLVTITVLEVKGNLVKLGIEAPKDMKVHRYEVWARIQTEPVIETGEHEQEKGAA